MLLGPLDLGFLHGVTVREFSDTSLSTEDIGERRSGSSLVVTLKS